jgi:hypothetical protein
MVLRKLCAIGSWLLERWTLGFGQVFEGEEVWLAVICRFLTFCRCHKLSIVYLPMLRQ